MVSVSSSIPKRLLDSVDDSAVVAYVKDLDGRYLHVNARYQEFFDISAADILGRHDAELEPSYTIDGPRLASGSVSEDEPLQLEYTVAPFDGRPAVAVWRFAVRGADDDTVAVCGVAATVSEAHLARSECERLMARIAESKDSQPETAVKDEQAPTDRERIAALHDASANAARRAHELLSELTAERERRAEAEAQLNAVHGELEAARAELAAEREQRGHTEQERIDELRRRLEHANDQLQVERTRADEAAASLDGTRAALEAARAERDSVQGKLEQIEGAAQQERARAAEAVEALHAARADADAEREASGPRWDSAAQRAFTTALSQSSDWRISVKSAIGVLGAQGGWDAVCAWQPDDRHGFASCFAMWTGEHRRLAALETATWQRRQPLTGSTIGEALTWEEPQWLVADAAADDRRLQLLAQHGIRGALIVPVKEGNDAVAALELLTVSATGPSRELVEAIETIVLQLGHFSQLLSAGAQHRWRFGRM